MFLIENKILQKILLHGTWGIPVETIIQYIPH